MNLSIQKQNKIFIAGCGRSGTTLLRMIINSHPDVYIPIESMFFVDYLKYGAYLPSSVFRMMFFNEPMLKKWYKGGRIKSDIASVISEVHELAAKKNSAKIWGQKTPRFIREIELFEKNISNIKWILIYRDPRAVISSMLQTKNQTNSIIKACKRWKKDNRVIIDLMDAPKPNIMLVKYENLILNMDESIKAIFKFIGISVPDIADIINQEIDNSLVSGNPKYNTSVRSGLKSDIRKIDSWKRKLSFKEIAYIERYCHEEMNRLSYYKQAQISKNIPFCPLLNIIKDTSFYLHLITRFPKLSFYTLFRKSILNFFFFLNK